MRMRAVGFLSFLVLGLLFFASGASAQPSSSCTPSPAGWLCTYDAEGDGVPERVFVYSDQQFPLVTADVWRQSGSDTVALGSATDYTPWSPTSNRVTFTQFDSGSDGSAEERTVRVDSWLPSDIKGFGSVTLHDANGSGAPERASVFVYHSHYGTYSWDAGTALP